MNIQILLLIGFFGSVLTIGSLPSVKSFNKWFIFAMLGASISFVVFLILFLSSFYSVSSTARSDLQHSNFTLTDYIMATAVPMMKASILQQTNFVNSASSVEKEIPHGPLKLWENQTRDAIENIDVYKPIVSGSYSHPLSLEGLERRILKLERDNFYMKKYLLRHP